MARRRAFFCLRPFAAPLRACVALVDSGSLGPGALNVSLAAVAANASAAGLGLYLSTDGVTWESTENGTLERAGGSGAFRLCGNVWHFSLIAGLAAPARASTRSASVCAST